MKRKVQNAVQVSIMLPQEIVNACKREARQRAVAEQSEVAWTDVLRAKLAK